MRRQKRRSREGVDQLAAFLDPSIVVRYLTGDPEELAEVAATVIDGEEDLVITAVVLAETAYVLTSVYKVTREVVVDHLIALLQKENIKPFALDKGLV